MMTAESHNNIFNRALNPHNTHLGAGGSSGGEGALIAFRGSILGVGTDVAGSIRIPALCNGVYGFRPTVDRIPYGGQAKRMWAGVPSIKACAGPLGHSLEDLEMFMRCVVGVDPWRYDVNALSMGWSGIQEERKLRIGVLPVDEHYPLHPPVRRALNKAVDELTRQGHTIVYLDDIPSRSLSLASRIAFQYFFYRPKDNAITASGEPEIPSVAKCWSPMFTGPAVAEENADLFTQISQLYTARLAYCEAWRDAWMQNGLDAVVAPGSQSTAVPHDTFGWPSYTAIWNVLDYPCCIIPYGKASKELDPEPMMVNDDQQPSYNPDEQDGAPTSIQVIARQFQDEKCLWAARIINNALNR
ncbi:hypothetical protein MW887_003650 [Aspergillus wentii]|nr:hypothetical protein MW887_003650 [Aspergillus wentii]